MGEGFGPGRKFALDKKLKICYNNNTKEKGKKFPKKIKNLLTNHAKSAIIKTQRKERER